MTHKDNVMKLLLFFLTVNDLSVICIYMVRIDLPPPIKIANCWSPKEKINKKATGHRKSAVVPKAGGHVI